MLKAVTGFTLPDNVRVEANTEVPEDFASEAIMFRLQQKGVLVPIVGEEDPATEALDAAPAVSEPSPPSPTKKKRGDVTELSSAEEQK